ncbi:MAG: FtsX-like permease family protein [Kiritimatiellae bacterium]|nr:FtsX-like permease family protein [Kiritimatiellia bacterium]
MKARHVCAVVGVAFAVGAVVFMRSLVASNDAQSESVARRLMSALPVGPDAQIARLALDFRPEGRVMQGPPLMAVVATKPGVEGVAIAKSVFAARRLDPPGVGEELAFLGRNGAYRLKVSEILDWDRPPGRGAAYPTAFVSPETAAAIGEEWSPFTAPSVAELAPAFRSDAGRNFDRAKALLLWAAALTALCLLVNSLFLSIEAKRRDIAVLRMLGMTRGGVVRRVAAEAVALALGGLAAGVALAFAATAAYVAFDRSLFPEGPAFSFVSAAACAALAPLLAVAASLVALKSALAVKPLEAASARLPRKRHVGMVVSFAFGFGAFVAVEVWGASLMSAFVPSEELPDAIVSILPGGVSSFDIEKVRNVEGVARIAELQPLQVNILPLEELKMPGAEKEQQPARDKPSDKGRPPRKGPPPGMGGPPRAQYRNALLLASEWLPDFRFSSGSHDEAEREIKSGDACVITEMMARARGWSMGDEIELDCGRGHVMRLRIVGIVDLNWHMVTSRGLVRGLNRMPVNTDGPVFVSFDTLAACDPRPQDFVRMTHLWLDYTPEFLAAHGVFGAGRIVENEIVKALNGADLVTREGEVRGNTVRLHSRGEIADGTLAHGADLIGSMARVPFIFIAVVSLGFIAMLVASADARRREFAVLRAVGATRPQLAAALAREAAQVAWKGIVLGLLGGAPAGWLFTFGTRKAMANWGLPASFAVPWETLAVGAALAFAFALAVAVPTALALVRPRR